ncbi:MAG: MoxR family ATPase [Planctomycetes bacterium]|nr:MoxR family ATPase [Planctomycetota bacterium]
MALPADPAEMLDEFGSRYQLIAREISKAIIGQHEVVDEVLIGLFTGTHSLLIGVPGLAKTSIVQAVADVLDLKFKRIQFTPDLMPSDITGTNVLRPDASGGHEFSFVPGPVFCNIVLADEINRTPPKTQAALLESMQERQVSVGDETYPLPNPFFVIATQNPIEHEGTYPLPEAQLDRFLFSIKVDYPGSDEEQEIYRFHMRGRPVRLRPVLSREDVLRMSETVRRVVVGDHIVDYVNSLVRATRPGAEGSPPFVNEYIAWGVGTRGGIFLLTAARAWAAMDGRLNVSIDDIRKVAYPCLRHRLGLNFRSETEGIDADELIRRLVDVVPAPGANL